MIGWLLGLWRKRQRDIDTRILWPVCCEAAANSDEARMAFAIHARMDPAWSDLTPEEFDRQITALPYPGETK